MCSFCRVRELPRLHLLFKSATISQSSWLIGLEQLIIFHYHAVTFVTLSCLTDIAEFVNQTLRFYIDWYKPSEVGGNIPFSKNLIHRKFDALTDEQMDKVIEDYIKHEFKEELGMLGREYTFSSVMDAVCAWADASRFPYRHDDKNNSTDTYAIRFNMGERWSHFF